MNPVTRAGGDEAEYRIEIPFSLRWSARRTSCYLDHESIGDLNLSLPLKIVGALKAVSITVGGLLVLGFGISGQKSMPDYAVVFWMTLQKHISRCLAWRNGKAGPVRSLRR
jgi:hypothetical protein